MRTIVPSHVKPKPPSRVPRRQQAAAAPLGSRLLKFALAFAACALALDALVGARGLPAVLESRREYQALSGELGRIRGENARLRHEVRRLREDPEAIEEIARRDLHLIRPGEKVFIIRDVAPPDRAKPR
jgi:cell division protein FtsB